MQTPLTKIKLAYLPGGERDWQRGMGDRGYTERPLEVTDVQYPDGNGSFMCQNVLNYTM